MRVTLLSNGHGEDAVGVLLARAFLDAAPNLRLQAFPTVGRGTAYEALGLPILGPRRELPSGGWMMHTASAFWADLRAGFIPMTGAQLRDLGRLETDLLVVVGDMYALMLGSRVRTPRCFYVQTLVSAHLRTNSRPNRYFMERISVPERWLMRRAARHSYLRDTVTAKALRGYGLPVSALGNPMLDALTGAQGLTDVLPAFSPDTPVVALLPGTRSYREEALATMLHTLYLWPEAVGLIAWAGESLPNVAGWHWSPLKQGVWLGTGPAGTGERIYLLHHRFADVLHDAKLVLGTAGTANEQAASLGLPVVSFPVLPLYSDAFVHNQARLLGAALSVSTRESAALLHTLQSLWTSAEAYRRAAEAGLERMGAVGGSAAIVRDILARSR